MYVVRENYKVTLLFLGHIGHLLIIFSAFDYYDKLNIVR